MTKIRAILILSALLLSFWATCQSLGDYRSFQTGNWNNVNSWETFNGTSWVIASTIPFSSDGTITIRNGHIITITSNLSADQIIVETGGTLTISSSLILNDGTGDDLKVDGTLNIGNAISGDGILIGNGIVNWNSGTLQVPTNLNSSGVFNILTSTEKTLNNSLTNNGIINWSDGNIYLSNATIANNNQFNITADNRSLNSGTGTNSFINNSGGIINKNVSLTPVFIKIPLTNNGAININTGGLINTSTFSNNKNIYVGINCNLTNQELGIFNLNEGCVFTGSGNINHNATTNVNTAIAMPSTLTNTLTNTLKGSGSLNLEGILNWNNGSLQVPTTLSSTAVLNILTSTEKTLNNSLTNNG
ncbi:MAG TPA: hypothetical protein PLP23_14735, partial [Panacibacter sp.]|nr:hypothetical protein [Panacibacter sp.]